jgi:hypothetical protein
MDRKPLLLLAQRRPTAWKCSECGVRWVEEKKSSIELSFEEHVKKNHQGKRTSGQKRDFMEVARGIVEQAIGEQMDGTPLPTPPKDERNPHAVALGSMGGRKGGKARAKKLSTGRKKAIAKKAAKARWQ